jgi:uncharacterized protein YacL
MKSSLLVIRIVFILLCLSGSYLIALVVPEWDDFRWRAVFIGGSIGVLVLLVDLLLKGFSLRGMSALTFGLFVGWLGAFFITTSPVFEFPLSADADSNVVLTQNLFLARLATFVVMMYLGSVIALRGKDEFNLVIPYVRFVPHGVEVPLAVVDTSALIDSRLVGICEAKFLGHALIIPSFVIDELHRIADSSEPNKQSRGRRGLETLRRLRDMKHVDLRIDDSTVEDRQRLEAKIVFLARTLKAKILTTDFNLAQIAEFHNVEWLDLHSLTKALNPQTNVGDFVRVEVVKEGKDAGQGVGFLFDGSMVVVNHAAELVGSEVEVEIASVIPTSGGRMIFAELSRTSSTSRIPERPLGRGTN